MSDPRIIQPVRYSDNGSLVDLDLDLTIDVEKIGTAGPDDVAVEPSSGVPAPVNADPGPDTTNDSGDGDDTQKPSPGKA